MDEKPERLWHSPRDSSASNASLQARTQEHKLQEPSRRQASSFSRRLRQKISTARTRRPINGPSLKKGGSLQPSLSRQRVDGIGDGRVRKCPIWSVANGHLRL